MKDTAQLISPDSRPVPREVENNMSVFGYFYRWTSFKGFFKNIAQFFHNIGDMFHRAKYGFCKHDVWNCDSTITDYLINILTAYRNETLGYPQDFESHEKWIAYLDEVIDLLVFSRTDSGSLNPYDTEDLQAIFQKEMKDRTDEEIDCIRLYWKEEQKIYAEQEEARIEALVKLAPHINSLWW